MNLQKLLRCHFMVQLKWKTTRSASTIYIYISIFYYQYYYYQYYYLTLKKIYSCIRFSGCALFFLETCLFLIFQSYFNFFFFFFYISDIILDNGVMDKDLVEESKFGKMGLYTKDTGKMIWQMEEVD